MGTVIGAIATGAVPANASHASLAAWTSPTALLAGFLFVAACGYLAAVYLVGEAARRGDRRMQAYFTRRAQAAGDRGRGAVAGHPGRAAQLESGAVRPPHRPGAAAGDPGRGVRPGRAGPAHHRPACAGVRVIAALGVAAVVWGWGVAQYPVLLPGTTVTLSNAGAPQATLVAIVVLFVVVVLLIGPSFALLFTLQGRRLLRADEAQTLPATIPAGRPQPPVAPWEKPPADQGPVIRAAVLALVALAAFVRRLRHR